MRILALSAAVAAILTAPLFAQSGDAPPPQTAASAAVVIDAAPGQTTTGPALAPSTAAPIQTLDASAAPADAPPPQSTTSPTTTTSQSPSGSADSTATPPPLTPDPVVTATADTPPPPVAPDPLATPPADTPPPPLTPPPPPPQPAPSGPGVLSDAASRAYERREDLPSVNLYLPEGQASIRVRKLIKNTLFESQIDYEFVNGDISTFLRYKYYARNYTYRIGVFDSIEFPDLGSSDDKEFERVRGGLLLIGIPKDFNNRYFVLLQDDRLTFGDTDRPDNRKNNIYTKIGYQYGTPFDEKMNAIVGEQRGRITPVLTAFRDIGPQRTGLAAAVTQAVRLGSEGDGYSDYTYTKFEAEGLRRFDITATSFLFSRVHVGTFLARDEVQPELRDRDGDGIVDPTPAWERYDIPQYELFRLSGREALRGVRANDRSIGTHEVHLTNELYVPIFRNREYKLGPLYWNTLYGVGYTAVGSVGFEVNQLTDPVVDVGIGTESAITYRDWDVYLSVLYARPVVKAEGIEAGSGFRFSVRTVR